MPRPCSVCIHERVRAIDTRLSAGTPQIQVAQEFGLTEMSVSRHVRHRTSRASLRDVSETLAPGASLTEQLEGMSRVARVISQNALSSGDIRGASSALRLSVMCASMIQTIKAQEKNHSHGAQAHFASSATESLRRKLLDDPASDPPNVAEHGIADPTDS
jgi:hypothetical protein